MYRPHGRYRYTYGVVSFPHSVVLLIPDKRPQNWRAALAMIVSVPFTLPGLVHSINTNIHVGIGTRLFDIAFLLEVGAPSLFST